jgi:hypothetical protein
MPDVTVKVIDEMEAIYGGLAAGLGRARRDRVGHAGLHPPA